MKYIILILSLYILTPIIGFSLIYSHRAPEIKSPQMERSAVDAMKIRATAYLQVKEIYPNILDEMPDLTSPVKLKDLIVAADPELPKD